MLPLIKIKCVVISCNKETIFKTISSQFEFSLPVSEFQIGEMVYFSFISLLSSLKYIINFVACAPLTVAAILFTLVDCCHADRLLRRSFHLYKSSSLLSSKKDDSTRRLLTIGSATLFSLFVGALCTLPAKSFQVNAQLIQLKKGQRR